MMLGRIGCQGGWELNFFVSCSNEAKNKLRKCVRLPPSNLVF